MIVSSCSLREEHRIVRCEPGNCETCERVFNWTKQVRKETAENIFQEINHLIVKDKTTPIWVKERLIELAKQFGVEIKEGEQYETK